MLVKKRVFLLCLAAVVLVGVLFAARYLIRFNRYQRQVQNLTLSDIDLSAVADGVYTGACDADFVAAQVRVTVQNGAIAGIELLSHHQERGASAEVVLDRIVAEQRIDVDIVSGATNSSRVLEKAVENALRPS